MNTNTNSATSPLVKFISAGLKLWIKTRCKSVDELSIDLCGSTLQVLRGNVKNVNLKAERINFDDVLIDTLELDGGPIRLIFRKGSGRLIEIKDSFNIEGKILLTAEDIKGFLLSERWSILAKQLCRTLTNFDTLHDVEIEENNLYFWTSNDSTSKTEFNLYADFGTLVIIEKLHNRKFVLPMDPSIAINKAFVSSGKLNLLGKAVVNP